MDKILIIGGSGYIGSILTQHLVMGEMEHEITVLDNLIDGQWSLANLCHKPNFNFIRGDIRDTNLLKELLPKFEIVIPLSAYVGEAACRINPWDAQTVNTEAIKNLISFLSKEQLLLFPMTNSGYGTTDGNIYCTEESPLNPISIYGKTKVEAEKYVLDRENSISFRLATVFGMSPKMRWELLVNFYVYEAMRSRYMVVFEKNFKRNYIHIMDVARCFEFAIKRQTSKIGIWPKLKYNVYNLGLDTANISKEELALKIKKYVPDFFIHFNDFQTDVDKRNYIVSNARILSEGFKPIYDLDYGIQELIKGYDLLGGSKPSKFNQ
jgi:nucleoside-diphosphate-sugar epimerase